MTPRVAKAREFALEAHGSQQYGVHPYVVHLDAVAELVRERGDEAQVVAYLHDVVEDTSIESGEIARVFGQRVADAVEVLTDEPGGSREERKRKSHARLARVSDDLEVALLVKAADRLANMRACVADGDDEKLAVYKKEHAAFREAAYRRGLAEDFWHEMEEIRSSLQHGGFNHRFYSSPDSWSLIRRRHRPGESYYPEIQGPGGSWVTAPPTVMDAITGLSDDPYSGPSWYADPLTPEEARAYAAERGIVLFAEHCEDPSAAGRPSLAARLFSRVLGLVRRPLRRTS